MQKASCLIRTVVLSSALLIIAANSLGAEINEQVALPDFQKQSLLNGMEILFLPTMETHVPFVLMIKNGAAFDPIEKWGVTYLTARMMLEGTESRAGAHIQEDLQKIGAKLDFQADWDAIFFVGSAPVERVPDALSVLAEVIIRPKFEEKTFVRLRDQIMKEIEEQKQHPEVLTQNLFISNLFKGNPYEHPVMGNAATIKNLYLADIKIQYRRLFMPNQAQLAVYYSGEREVLFTKLSRRWGSWVKGDPLPFSFRQAEPLKEDRVLLVDQPLQQSLFRWGNLSSERGSRDYYTLKVFEQYLMLSLPAWAGQVAQDRIKALPKLEARRMPGYVQLSIQSPPEHLAAYAEKFKEFLAEIQAGRVDPEKLEEAKRLAFLEFKKAFTSPLTRLFQILETDLYNLGVTYITNYAFRLNRITPESLQNVVKQHLFTAGFLLVAAGPAEILRPQLEKFGKLELTGEGVRD